MVPQHEPSHIGGRPKLVNDWSLVERRSFAQTLRSHGQHIGVAIPLLRKDVAVDARSSFRSHTFGVFVLLEVDYARF